MNLVELKKVSDRHQVHTFVNLPIYNLQIYPILPRTIPLMCQTLHRKNFIVIFLRKSIKEIINTIIYFGRGMKIQSWCLVFITFVKHHFGTNK